MKIGTGASKRIIVGKRKDADTNGIGIGITGIARSSFTVGRKISSFPLSGIALSATIMIGMIDPIGAITTIIGDLMDRLEEERPFTIGWGAVGYFKRKQKNLQAHGYRCSFHPGVFQSIDFPQRT